MLQKALDLLEVLAEQPDLGLSELSEKTGASKASTYRMLSTLESRGFVVKRGDTRKYAPGVQLVALSCAVVARLDLVKAARPYLEELQRSSNETVNLGILADAQVLYVDILESDQGLRMAAHVGARDALHSTALGKAILSALPTAEARQLLGSYRRLPATPRTIVSLEALMDDLAATAARGYSIDDEENEAGARCVGVPIRDLVGPRDRRAQRVGPVDADLERRDRLARRAPAGGGRRRRGADGLREAASRGAAGRELTAGGARDHAVRVLYLLPRDAPNWDPWGRNARRRGRATGARRRDAGSRRGPSSTRSPTRASTRSSTPR